MKLKVLGSSSAGNCYILENDSEALILEAGVKFAEVQRALNFNINKIAGCLSSHIHSDHSRAIKDFLQYAIPVYVSKEHKQDSGITSEKLIAVEPNSQIEIADFSVIPFNVPHDVPCLGFLINHKESGVILFLTDCYYCPKRFLTLNNILIEVNYRMDILDENTRNGRISAVQRNRTLQSHMSYDTCIKTLLANDLRAVNNIVLIHLSNSNSHAQQEFKEGIRKATGKTVHIADSGLELSFNKTPF
ncbi:MAG: MBL fold metallo-hydrolase [Dysgonamonadaceae bacterium]|jgi:phosphoribosyl 1,2-cyclic phosphodiesterase|nr:MBL fold metallo-hydrolase [Dysgonamonadaceae bacterium]